MPHKRILLTRRIPGPALPMLSRRFDVDLNRGDRPLTPQALRRRIRHAHGLLCLPSDRIDRQVLDAAPRLEAIANCAVGVNNIDLDETRRRGIPVTNTPGVLTDATADLTWGLILAVTRRIVEGDRMVREGRFHGWGPELLLGQSLQGKVLGIIGMGRIGQAVAARAAPFSMRLVYTSRTRLAQRMEAKLHVRFVTLRKLLACADVITIHLPLSAPTHRLLGERELATIKRGAYLINTSRGEIVDETRLISALKSGRLAGAGLDVYAREPHVPAALLRMRQVVLLPHIGSATRETRQAMAMTAARNLVAMLTGNEPANRVI